MTKCDDTGKLILRLAVGILVLLHGLMKISSGVGGIEGMLTSQGLPAFIAYGAYLGEVVGPLLVIVGLYTRVGALLMTGSMVVAILLAHMGQLGSLNAQGGWALELQGMFLFGSLAVLFLGAGRFSLGGSGGRWN